MADVRIRVVGEDKASRELKKVDNSLANLKKSAAEVGGKEGFGALQDGLKTIAKAAAIAGVAIAALETAKKAFDFTREGAQLMRLEASGESLAASLGSNLDTIVSKLKEVSFNTISSADAIGAANRAMMLGLSADADKLGALMEVASFRGRAMGLSTTQAFSDIVTGIGRLSPLILDNLGIIIDLERRTQEWADANGVAAASIDAATKRQILFNSVLETGKKQIEAAGGLAQDTAGEFEELTAAWNDFIDSQKKAAAEGLGGPGAVAEELRHITAVQELGRALREAYEAGKISSQEYSEIARISNDRTRGVEDAVIALDVAIHGMNIRAFQFKDTGYMPELEKTEIAAIKAAIAIDQLSRAAQRGKPLQNLIDERAVEQVEDAAKAMDELQSKTKDLWNTLSQEPTSFIESFLEDLDWFAAGGWRLTEAAQAVKEGVIQGKFTPEEGRQYMGAIYAATQDLQVDLNNITADEAAKNIEDTLGWSLKEAKDYISGTEGIKGALEAITFKEWRIDIRFNYIGDVPPGWPTAPGQGEFEYTPPGPSRPFGENDVMMGNGKPGAPNITIQAINIYPTPGMDEIGVGSEVVGIIMDMAEANRGGEFAGIGYAG